ncbi:MAG: pectate lyase [Candidatus Omnitrophica bacterium]|nr:pectate lyase [Candidatus Omnitrophota bacterium]
MVGKNAASIFFLFCFTATGWLAQADSTPRELHAGDRTPRWIAAAPAAVTWKQCRRQSESWHHSQEAVRIADNVLLHQHDDGGWPKNTDMAAILTDREKDELRKRKTNIQESTIDNGATYTPMIFLAKMFNAVHLERYKSSFSKGLDFLLDIQYENGGWPQFPHRRGYFSHITFNDNAMIGVMNLLRDILDRDEYAFVDPSQKNRAEKALQKGVACILKCQIQVDGERTVWCAQHDENNLQPAPARTYEKISLSGSESVGIVRFLMGIENPSPEVIDAVQSAVRWFQKVQLTGVKQVMKPDPSLPRGYDKIVVSDDAAPPLWARFYEIGANRPIFCGRDGVVKYALAEIEHERRVGYGWYTDAPSDLLNRDYPEWQKKIEALRSR